MTENSLALIERASLMLAEANTIQATKELKDLFLTLADWAKRKGAGEDNIKKAKEYALFAERKMGDFLKKTEPQRAKGGQPYQKKPTSAKKEPVESTLKDLGITKKESSQAQFLADLSDEEFEEIRTGKASIPDVRREVKRKEIIEKLENIETKEVKAIAGLYDVIVIDPPWPMQKIERDERPNQSEFAYPTMTMNQISQIKLPLSDDCHVFLWSTQKFLPNAFLLLDDWRLKYVCAFVWHKPGGFQVVGLPQYNCEFILYARRGIPKFIDTKAFNTCFEAPRGKHSEKPNYFYRMIARVTAGRRLDLFSRRSIVGFDGWGKEAK